MQTWVVTGGAATGKSTFSRILVAGLSDGPACVFSSDACVRELLEDPRVAKKVFTKLDAGIATPDGSIDRGKLRNRIFASDRDRKSLEAILHPMVFAAAEAARNKALNDGAKLFIAEIPLFYETHSSFPADRIILVAASDIIQKRRMIETRGLDDATAQRILDSQLPLAKKLELATTVIWNEGSQEMLQAQATTLLQQLSDS